MARWVQVVRLRLRSLVRGSDVDRDLDRELRSHIAQEIDAHLASGMTLEEARRTAMLEFGSVSGIQEACRDTRRVAVIENIVRDLRYAGRTLVRQPALAVAGSLSIALGVGANLTIFSLANALLLGPPSGARPIASSTFALEMAAMCIEAVVDRVRSLPGVDGAAFTEGVPLTVFSGSRVGMSMRLEGAP